MILVTGGTGLVGGHLLWHLLKDNQRVNAICRPTSDLGPLRTIFSFYTTNPDEFLARVDWLIADVLNRESLDKAMKNVEVVYHCAAIVSLGKSSDLLMDTNVLGTRNVVLSALKNGIKKLCYVSSISSCGKITSGEKVDENCNWMDTPQQSNYARSKFYSEQEVWQGIDKGLNAVIVNPGVILGVSGNDKGSSQLFLEVSKGLMFYTNGGSGYVDVRDVVKAMIQLTNSAISAERFVLVGENCSNKDILSWMAEGFGKRRPFIPITKKLLWIVGLFSELFGKLFQFNPLIDRNTSRTATQREYYSAEKIKNNFGFKFTPIRTCIKEVCEFRKSKL